MSGSVWFITVRKKKIEFKKYPASKLKKKKTKKNNKGKKTLKSIFLGAFLIFEIIFFVNFLFSISFDFLNIREVRND